MKTESFAQVVFGLCLIAGSIFGGTCLPHDIHNLGVVLLSLCAFAGCCLGLASIMAGFGLLSPVKPTYHRQTLEQNLKNSPAVFSKAESKSVFTLIGEYFRSCIGIFATRK